MEMGYKKRWNDKYAVYIKERTWFRIYCPNLQEGNLYVKCCTDNSIYVKREWATAILSYSYLLSG